MARRIELASLFYRLEAESKGLEAELKNAEKKLGSLADFIKKNPVAAFGALGAAAIGAGFKLAQMAEEVNKAIGIIADRVPGATGKIEDLRHEANALAIQFGVTQDSVIKTMDAVSKAGVSNAEDLVIVTRAAIEAGKALGKNGEELVGGLDAALDIFGLSARDARAAMAQFFDVAQGRTSVEDLLDTVTKLAPAIQGTGLDFLTTTRALGVLIDKGFEPGKKVLAEFTERLQVGGVAAIQALANAATTSADAVSGMTDESLEGAGAIQEVADAAAGPSGAEGAMDRYTAAVNRNTNDIESNQVRAQTQLKAALLELGSIIEPLAEKAVKLLYYALGGGWTEASRRAKEAAEAHDSAADSFNRLGVAGSTAAGAAGALTGALLEAKNATQELGTKSIADLQRYKEALDAAAKAGTLDKESKTALIAVTKELSKREVERARDRAKAEQAASKVILASVEQIGAKMSETSQKLKDQGDQIRENWKASQEAQKKVLDGTDEIARLQAKVNELLAKYKTDQERIAAKDAERIANAQRLVSSLAGLATGLLGAAQAAGLLSANMASTLGHVINVAEQIAAIKFSEKSLFDPANLASLTGAIGSLVGVLDGLFGDSAEEKARKKLVAANTAALQELTSGVVQLTRIQNPASDVLGIQQALEAAFARSKDLPFVQPQFLTEELFKRGLSREDLNKLAQSFGFDLGESGNAFAGLRDLLEFLRTGKFSLFGPDFDGQLAKIREALSLGTLSKDSEFGAILRALGETGGGPAILKALEGVDFTTGEGRQDALTALRDLFKQISTQQFTGEEFAGIAGNLNSQQLIDVLGSLIAILSDPERAIAPVGDITPDRPPLDTETADFYAESLADTTEQTDLLTQGLSFDAQQVEHLAAIETLLGSIASFQPVAPPNLPASVLMPAGSSTVSAPVTFSGGIHVTVNAQPGADVATQAAIAGQAIQAEIQDRFFGDRYRYERLLRGEVI